MRSLLAALRRGDAYDRAWLCPWCRQQAVAVHDAGTPWLVRELPIEWLVTGIAWFSCAECREDGTVRYLIGLLEGEYPRHQRRSRRYAR